jgi:hypothetical protein
MRGKKKTMKNEIKRKTEVLYSSDPGQKTAYSKK